MRHPAREPTRIQGHEGDHEEQEQQVREGRRKSREDDPQERRDLAEGDLGQGGPDFVWSDPERGEPGAEVVDDFDEAGLVIRQDRGQLRHGERERPRETQDQPEDRDEGQGRCQPLRRTESPQVSGQGIHGDDENEARRTGATISANCRMARTDTRIPASASTRMRPRGSRDLGAPLSSAVLMPRLWGPGQVTASSPGGERAPDGADHPAGVRRRSGGRAAVEMTFGAPLVWALPSPSRPWRRARARGRGTATRTATRFVYRRIGTHQGGRWERPDLEKRSSTN